jgi:hypothetical protein
VEDFADRSQNVARSVSRKEFELIYQVLQSTVSNLKDPVYDVLEAKDLKAYLFGSIRQRHRHGVQAANSGTWQSGNGWSQPYNDRRSNVHSSRGHDSSVDSSMYADGAWEQPNDGAWGSGYVDHSQAVQGPVQRGNGYRKAGQSSRTAKVTSNGFDTHGQGESRNSHQSRRSSVNGHRMQYPPLDSRSSPVDNRKQVSVNSSSAYRDHGPVYKDWDTGCRKEDALTTSRPSDPSYSGSSFIHREVDFPTIETEHRVQYPEASIPVEAPSAFTGFAEFVEPSQMSYPAAGGRPRSHHSSSSPGIPAGAPQNQRTTYRHHHQRARRNHPMGADNRVGYRANDYQLHVGGNLYWQAQATPSNHQFLIR